MNDLTIFKEVEENNCAPEMPENLPSLIKLLVSKTAKDYEPAVAQSCFSALATYLYNVKFEYLDYKEHEATVMNLLIAPSSAGKDCIKDIIYIILEDIRERDQKLSEEEEKWKNAQKLKSSNDKKEERLDCPRQIISTDMTGAAFRDRLCQAKGRFLYSYIPEIELLQTKGQDKVPFFEIQRCAFDNDYYGAERKAIEGSSLMVPVKWNFHGNGTLGKIKAFFNNHLSSGVLNRMSFCSIPDFGIGAEMPKPKGRYDEQFKKDLKPYIENLKNASGKYYNEDIQQFTNELVEELRLESIKRQDLAYDNFRKRAGVIAFLKAYVLYIAEGEDFTKEMKEFIRWSAHYDMWCKMYFFGKDVRKAMERENEYVVKGKGGKESDLNLVNDEFTLEELAKAKGNMEKAKNCIKQWKCRGKIVSVDGKKDTYRKVG